MIHGFLISTGLGWRRYLGRDQRKERCNSVRSKGPMLVRDTRRVASRGGESFRTYVERVLVPTLREGDIVIMDNLGSHKGKAVRQLIRSAGAKLFFLPKYSPDLNPIEQV